MRNFRAALLLGALAALVVIAADALGGRAWGIVALVSVAALNFGAWYWSDAIVIAMHRARPLAYEEAPELHAIVRRLAGRANLPVPRIVYVPDDGPNAFATGRSPRHAVVAVTRGLLQLLDPYEMEGVIAHELSHVGSRDLRLALSRSREYGADATAAHLAGGGGGLASALAKLGAASRRIPMRTADPATSHLYIVEPLAGLGVSLANLLATHPPIAARIARLRALAAKDLGREARAG